MSPVTDPNCSPRLADALDRVERLMLSHRESLAYTAPEAVDERWGRFAAAMARVLEELHGDGYLVSIERRNVETEVKVLSPKGAWFAGAGDTSGSLTVEALLQQVVSAIAWNFEAEELERQRNWLSRIEALRPGDECEFRFPARSGWHAAKVIANGGSGHWRVEVAEAFEDDASRAAGQEVAGLYIENVRLPGQAEAWRGLS